MTDRTLFGRRDALGLGGKLALGGLAGSGLLAGLPLRALAAGAGIPANIVNTSGDDNFEVQELLHEQGYLEQLGLAPTSINVGDGSKLMGSLLSGNQDICMLSGFSQVFPAIEKGGKFKIVCGANMLADTAVYSKRPEIKNVKDLEGRSVGTGSPGALLHQMMIALCQTKGVDYKKITFVNIGSSADVFRAVVAGTVDAGPSQIDVFYEQAKYGVHSLTDGTMWSEIPQYTYQAAYTTEDTIAKKRDVLVRVLAGYAKLFRYIQSPDSKEAFVKARLTALTGRDPAQIRTEGEQQWEFFQKNKPFAVDLTVSPERIEYMQKLNITLGIQKTMLPYEQVTDMSLVQDALKMIA